MISHRELTTLETFFFFVNENIDVTWIWFSENFKVLQENILLKGKCVFDCFPDYKLLNVNLKEKFGVEGVYLFLFFYFFSFFFFFVFKTEKETQMYRTVFWTLWEKARVGCFKRTASIYVYYLG